MNKWILFLMFWVQCLLMACSPVKPIVTNQYKLDTYSEKQLSKVSHRQSILVTKPEAVGGYQTDEMLYVKKLFEIEAFAHSSWISPPADMLFPLIIQSLERSRYFYAVASSPNSDQTDYRLDTELIELEQNFLKKPSELDLVAKVVLTNVNDNRVVASMMISQHVRCPFDTPYGGVIAGNQATKKFTQELTRFVVTHASRDRR